jgi:WD40 repeat protein
MLRLSRSVLVWLLSFGVLYGQSSSRKQLSIEAVFGPGSITGLAPEGLHWAPDQKSFSYIQRDDSGEHGQLWLVNAASGEKKVLLSDEKLARLAPPLESIKDDRQKDQITRYHVAPYYWAPDSKHLLFTPHGQLWLYDLDSGTAVEISPSPDPVRDPKFSSDSKRVAYVRAHNLYIQPLDDTFRSSSPRATDRRKENRTQTFSTAKWIGCMQKSCRFAAITSGRRMTGRSYFCRWTNPRCPPIPSPTGCQPILRWTCRSTRRQATLIRQCAWVWWAAMAARFSGFR